MNKLKAKKPITFLLPANEYDREGATHSSLPEGAIVTLLHVEADEIVVGYKDHLVYANLSDFDTVPEVAQETPVHVHSEDIPF